VGWLTAVSEWQSQDHEQGLLSQAENLTRTGCPTRYRTRHFFNNFTVSHKLGALQTHTTDTHYRHAPQTRTTDTHHRHALQTRTTDTHHRHAPQTRTTDTHHRNALQTPTTDTHHRHALQTRTTDTHYRHALQTSTTDTFLFISHTTNVPLSKFRYNIFIGVRIIKEMPGSVASGTPCIIRYLTYTLC
jgi:hypothetical protein